MPCLGRSLRSTRRVVRGKERYEDSLHNAPGIILVTPSQLFQAHRSLLEVLALPDSALNSCIKLQDPETRFQRVERLKPLSTPPTEQEDFNGKETSLGLHSSNISYP
jgi:hypothetical protein